VVESFTFVSGAVRASWIAPVLTAGFVKLSRCSELAVNQFDKMGVAGTMFVALNGGLKPMPFDLLVGCWSPTEFVTDIAFQGWDGSSLSVTSEVIRGDSGIGNLEEALRCRK